MFFDDFASNRKLPNAMKNRFLIPAVVMALSMVPACERKSSDTAKQLEELQRKASEAVDRQKELERQIEDQKLASEREAIERDRMQIENDRDELARQQGDASANKAEEVRKREEALASREGRLEQLQSSIDEKQSNLSERGARLNDQERDLAGREALPFQSNVQQEPVGDYGMFYDQLSSYGSWFETPDYGYVWQPVAVRDSNWRPYSRGSWICSDRGWTWVSDEPFGWATYHYGRWALVRGRGWVWAPGSEWAPCWVSWRENGSHIGWAPLPPETLAYRNSRWDSSVDVQFGIGASWFNFVEIRHFGSPLYQYCLPVSNNISFFQQTTNITYIHIENRQVICGGPRYREVCDRIGHPIPFCRLEIDQHPRTGSNVIGMRPQIKGDRLLVSAPNIDAGWNEGMRPKRIKGRMDTVELERNEPLRPEIVDRFKKNREENVRIADRSIQQMGGSEHFTQQRAERLEQNRVQAEASIRNPEKAHDAANSPDRSPRPDDRRDVPKPVVRVSDHAETIKQEFNRIENPPQGDEPLPQVQLEPKPSDPAQAHEISEWRLKPQLEMKRPIPATELPREEKQVQPPEPQAQPPQPALPPQSSAQESMPRRENERALQQQEQLRQDQQKQQAEQVRETQKEAMVLQREQVRQRENVSQDALKSQQAIQAREAQKDAMAQQQQLAQQQQERERQEQENQRAEQIREAQKIAMAQQQERAQQQQERARREQENQQADQAREAQREAMAQQQDRARQQQQELRQQQQERARQQQEEQHQQQQGQARQQEQKKESDQNQEQERRRNR